MTGRKKAAVFIGGLLGAVLLAGTGLLIGATWNTMPERTQEQKQPSTQLLQEVVQGALTGSEIHVPVQEMNRYLVYLGEHSGHDTMKEMVLGIDQQGFLEVWMPVTYRWIHGTAFCRIQTEYREDGIRFKMLETKLGKLPLPVSFVLSLAKEKLPQTLRVEGDTLIFPVPKISLKEYGVDTEVGLTDVRIENGEFVLRTDSVTDALEGLLQGFLGQLLTGDSSSQS